MVKPGIYEHYKGGRYEVIATGLLEANEEAVVIYKTLYENPKSLWWVRPLSSFEEQVDVDGQIMPRFRFIEEA